MRKVLALTAVVGMIALSGCGKSEGAMWMEGAEADTTDFVKSANKFTDNCEPDDLEELTSGCGADFSDAYDQGFAVVEKMQAGKSAVGDMPDSVQTFEQKMVELSDAYTAFGQGPRTEQVKQDAYDSMAEAVKAAEDLN